MAIALSSPIQAHGKEVTELEFRRPVCGDVDACGYPFRMGMGEDGNMSFTPIAPSVSAMISRLGNIPRSSVSQLDPADWQSCMLEILSFFGTSTQRRLSTDVSISPGSGNGRQN